MRGTAQGGPDRSEVLVQSSPKAVFMASSSLKIAIVGGGLAVLAAAMKIAAAGHDVDLISVVPV